MVLFYFCFLFLLPLRQQPVTFSEVKGTSSGNIPPHSPSFQFPLSNLLLFENHLELIELGTLLFKKFQSTVGKGVWPPLDSPCRHCVWVHDGADSYDCLFCFILGL